MRKGRHESKHKPNGNRAGKHALLLLSLIVVLGVATVGTVAYFTATAQSTSTGFTIGNVACTVKDNGGNSFTVTNTSNVPAYIRVAVVANWVDGNGTLHYAAPAADKVTVTVPAGYTKVGDFYYSTGAAGVAVNGTADFTVSTTDTPPSSEYSFKATVVAEAIQGGVPAVAADAWGYTPNA